MEMTKAKEIKQGVVVFVVLAVLTVLEYFVGTAQWPVIFLWLIAFGKAGAVIWFFMHVFRAFREGGH